MSNDKSKSVRIGCGSGYGDDLIELAVDMADRGQVEYLCMDALAERTLMLAQLRRVDNPDLGYDLRLEEVAHELLPMADKRKVKIVSNMGAANPGAAGRYLSQKAREQGLKNTRVAVITGDNVRDWVDANNPVLSETGRPLSELPGRLVSANAYIGCEKIVEALGLGATVVIGGRIADPSLFVGPLVHHFGWSQDNWAQLGFATMVGHLLECGCYVTGGNFADPPYLIVPSFNRPSLPFADVDASGRAVLGKLPDTDGVLSVETCKEQLGYEIHDPANYLTPDVNANFTDVRIQAVNGGVAAHGATGLARPDTLKVLVGVDEGFVGEGQVSFAGLGALDRALLAQDIVKNRVEAISKKGIIDEIRYDLLGVNGIHGDMSPMPKDAYEVHLRVTARSRDKKIAAAVAHAVEYVQIFGPSGTAGHRRSVKPQLTTYTCFIPRSAIKQTVEIL